jgi:hypothetical protein
VANAARVDQLRRERKILCHCHFKLPFLSHLCAKGYKTKI